MFNKKETAEQLRIHTATLDRHVRKGRLGFVKLGGRVFFTQQDIEQFIKSCHRKPQWQSIKKIDA